MINPWNHDDAEAIIAAYADPAIQRWHGRRIDDHDEAQAIVDRCDRHGLRDLAPSGH